MKMAGWFLAAVIAASAAHGVAAQDNAADVLSRARVFYSSGQFDSTVSQLQSWLKKNGKADSAEYIVPLLMEALVRNREYRSFDKLFSIYEQKFSSSDFMPRVYYLKGTVLARQEKREDAVSFFSKAVESGAGDPLDTMSLRNVKVLCAGALSESELARLTVSKSLHPSILEIVSYYEFSRLYEADKVENAQSRAEAFRKRFPGSSYDIFARDIISRSRSQRRKQVPVGLLAPLTGEDADAGRHVMQAVQLAVEKHNQTSQVQVRLITGDTEGGMIKTAQLTKDMLTANRIPVIIGPVLSSNAIVCASMLFEKNAVMITPTATDDGIGSLGSNVFQLNVTPATLGRRIAAYAMDNLMIRDFAVIAPSSDYGKVLAGGFIEEVKKRNAELVSEQYFEEGTKDFRTQFESLRRSLLEKRRHALALKKGLAYSPAPTAKEMRIDSARYADSTLSVGGLFIPAEAEDVVMLAPQAQFHRIQTQMLGSTGWHTQTTVRAGKQYVNNAIISTSAETDLKDSQWSDFSAAYKKRFGMEPDRVAAVLAWDAASLVLMAIDKYGDDVKEIANSLHSVRGYKGLSGPVSFGQENGTNTEAAIVKIKDGNFLKIQ